MHTQELDYEWSPFLLRDSRSERNASARENQPTRERWDAAVREKNEGLQTKPKLLTLCVALTFFCLTAASRLSLVGWFLRALYYPWGKMETTRSIPKGWTERFLLWPIDLSFSFGRAPTSFSGSSPTHSSEREDPGNEGGNSAWLQSGTSWVRFRADKHVPVVVRSPGMDQYQGLKITGKWRYFLCPANG